MTGKSASGLSTNVQKIQRIQANPKSRIPQRQISNLNYMAAPPINHLKTSHLPTTFQITAQAAAVPVPAINPKPDVTTKNSRTIIPPLQVGLERQSNRESSTKEMRQKFEQHGATSMCHHEMAPNITTMASASSTSLIHLSKQHPKPLVSRPSIMAFESSKNSLPSDLRLQKLNINQISNRKSSQPTVKVSPSIVASVLRSSTKALAAENGKSINHRTSRNAKNFE